MKLVSLLLLGLCCYGAPVLQQYLNVTHNSTVVEQKYITLESNEVFSMPVQELHQHDRRSLLLNLASRIGRPLVRYKAKSALRKVTTPRGASSARVRTKTKEAQKSAKQAQKNAKQAQREAEKAKKEAQKAQQKAEKVQQTYEEKTEKLAQKGNADNSAPIEPGKQGFSMLKEHQTPDGPVYSFDMGSGTASPLKSSNSVAESDGTPSVPAPGANNHVSYLTDPLGLASTLVSIGSGALYSANEFKKLLQPDTYGKEEEDEVPSAAEDYAEPKESEVPEPESATEEPSSEPDNFEQASAKPSNSEPSEIPRVLPDPQT
ncbi:hypothetical protein CANCADRAFT_42414 [Tortispora caseinolytica NRRL Y-17796]|uniref:Uncharacterized protein n=1 Tax=Tortispora caseinolytica NRRL Y-17796 TaxID=767744 RepID=A0A1E4TJ53_9ASCO|nr:hypothetical protein CANCADRAFT_42414 [Tortispora caseinolytica NRRL Y-17796]